MSRPRNDVVDSRPRAPAGERPRRSLTKAEAEELMDWLEASGCLRLRLLDGEGGFVVSVEWPPPHTPPEPGCPGVGAP